MQLLEDVGAFALSRAVRAGRRVVRHARRRYELHRRLRGTVGVAGAVELQRSIEAPISRSPVAACRVVVERRADDGVWSTVQTEASRGPPPRRLD